MNVKVAGIVLAAGRSRRLGGEDNKCLLPVDGVPMVVRVARLSLETCATTVVTTGFDADAVQDALSPLADSVRIAFNPNWESGQASSLKTGLTPLAETFDGCAIFLADQPCVQPETVRRLLAEFRVRPHEFIAPRHQGRRGNPVIIPAHRFYEIMALGGDAGARPLLKRYGVHEVDVSDPGVLLDVDTMSDYAALRDHESDANQP